MNVTVLSGRYRLGSKLGSGGMSTVYLAQDEVLDRPVAVKLLHREISEEADQLERFRREARSAARLSHPNLVGVIDAGEDEGRPYIVFEYVEGQTLKQRIQDTEGGLEVDEAVAYAIEIGRGLSAAHSRKLIHRDVKPQNVLIDPDGRAKVTDFGIARSLESEGLTATGRVLGTTDYVSPEQAMGVDVDERSDVYSLGVVLYEMLSGEVPFRAETQVGVAMKHVNNPMPDIRAKRPEVPVEVAGVITRSTAKDSRDRYANVSEMVLDLETGLGAEEARGNVSHGEATTVLDSVPRSRRPGARRVSGAGIAMGLTGIALIAAALLFGQEGLDKIQGDESKSAQAIRPVAAEAFDPEGIPPGEEHNEATGLAIDNDPATAWTTEAYSAGLEKSGVGLSVDAGKEITLSAVEIRFEEGGADVEIRSAPGQSQPPEDLNGWKVIGQASGVDTRGRIEIDNAEPSQLYLVWITKLPGTEGDQSAAISDIRLFGS